MSLSGLFFYLLLILGVAAIRVYVLLPRVTSKVRSTRRRDASDTCSLAVFLGSGGHTSEALALISALDFSRYAPRKYIISDGDTLSAQKAKELEGKTARLQNLTGFAASYEILVIPRARRVHQSLITTPPTVIWSLISILKYLIHFSITSQGPFADVLLLNGPGTCFVLCAAVYILRFLGRPTPRTIYIESFARVNSLSLSGKLLRPIVDSAMAPAPERWRSRRVPRMACMKGPFARSIVPQTCAKPTSYLSFGLESDKLQQARGTASTA